MFQPNSIRSLLQKRQSAKVPAESAQNPAATSKSLMNQMENVVQTKLLIKDIDHQVSSIRQWREHQKELLDQQIKSNEEVKKAEIQGYRREKEGENKTEDTFNQQIIDKMQNSQLTLLQNSSSLMLQTPMSSESDSALFDRIAQTHANLYQIKHEGPQEPADNHSAFLNSIEEMGDIFGKPAKINENNKKSNVNKDGLKLQLLQIEQQLREMQELLRD